nr:erythromycin esterase family protein [uncultured Carboxylicivirga sp.]
MKRRITFSFILLACSIAPKLIQAQIETGNYCYPINSLVPEDNDDDLQAMSPIFTDKKLIGLGEATHGTAEFNTVRDRLIRYLAKNHQVNAVIFEADFASTATMNKHLCNNSITQFDTAIIYNWSLAHINYGNLALLSWIKSYNLKAKPSEQIRLYGCDMQWPESVANYLQHGLKSFDCFTDEEISTLRSINTADKLRSKSKKELEKIEQTNDAIGQKLDSIGNLPQATRAEKELLLGSKVLKQGLERWHMKGVRRYFYRDESMAQNCKTILDLPGIKNGIVWAHNAHIANASDQSEIKPMGAHLKQMLGNSYLAVGFEFLDGTFMATNAAERKRMACEVEPADAKCVDIKLAECKYENYLLDVKSASKDKSFDDLLNKKVWSRQIGSKFFPGEVNGNYRKHVVSKSYDALVFIEHSTPARFVYSGKYKQRK